MESPPPESKKRKMSTTTSDDDDATEAHNPSSDLKKPQRFKRRKIAIFLAYCGAGYQGMQKNPGAKTIESDLEEALFLSGAITDSSLKHCDWARAARTDKGVSAVAQVVSGRFYVDPPGLVERLNSRLSPQIRIFGYKRVTASYSAKKFCDRRRYVYLLPVFALDPTSHPNRESVLASVGSDTELVKCSECSERGRKVVGLVNGENGAFTENGKDMVLSQDERFEEIDKTHIVPLTYPNGDSEEIPKSEGTEKIEKSEDERSGNNKNANKMGIEVTEKDDNAVPDLVGSNDSGENGRVPAKACNFCYGEYERERFNRIINHYVGTHNFHNFTTRIKAEDPSARRYIVSFSAETVITIDGMDFVRCEVVGQSFMLHQIRKMVGLAVAVMRNCAPESLIQTALRKDLNLNVPTAPEVGLYLDECMFPSYNQKWKDSHEELSMEAFAEQAEEFRKKYIYSHIASMEKKEGVVGLWLHSLNHRNYPDLSSVEAIEVYANVECS